MFTRGAGARLLPYVKDKIYKANEKIDKANEKIDKAKDGRVVDVLNAIDSFPSRSSLYILNQDMGSVLGNAVKKFEPTVALELGYCYGCTAIRIASNMTKSGSKLLTLQPNEYTTKIAKQLINYAGLSEKVEVETSTLTNGDDGKLKEFLTKMGAPHFDFVFIDHLPPYYLRDFLFLRDKGMLGKGTVIVANTMGYSAVQNYLKYLKDHPEELETETYRSESGSTMTVSTYLVD